MLTTDTQRTRVFDIGPGFARARECPDCGHSRCGEDCVCDCDAAHAEHEAAQLHAQLQRQQLVILSANDQPRFTDLTRDGSRYRSLHEPEPSVSWSGAVTRLHQRIANAKRIEDGPELFEALRGEP